MSGSARVVSPEETPFSSFDGSFNTPPSRPSSSRFDEQNLFASSVFDTPPTPTNGVPPGGGLRERRLSRPGIADILGGGGGGGGDIGSIPPLQLVIQQSDTSPPRNSGPEMLSGVGTAGEGVGDQDPFIVEVALEGRAIFENFIQEEVTAAGLTPPPDFTPFGSRSGSTVATANAMATQTTSSLLVPQPAGRELLQETAQSLEQVRSIAVGGPQQTCDSELGRRLNEIAKQFERSQERKAVLDLANTVDFNTFNKDSFMNLLADLFPGSKISLARIVTLFVFCRDLAVRYLREKMRDLTQNVPNLFSQMMNWAFFYISDRMCMWVYEHGGWRAVLSGGLTTAWSFGPTIRSVVIAAVIASIGIYFIRKGL